ncbi:alpha,alpha-trehalose-phosphate synthase (UDP-forming) [Brevundimonas pishanensis]|uniref:alpha,alpha-trehalose-phosphate synthase (UDP-forming) n=1 Tax=Brevundimonas pishanensis TaxID=2896315 RepID=UPI001FA7C4FF
MGRLIVVSNRVQAPKDASDSSVGGLAMALAAALRAYDGFWFGWSGETTEEFDGQMNVEERGGVTIKTIPLEAQDVDEYYNGYANKTLWPLFHHRIDLTAYERSYSHGYERTNKRFAEVLEPMLEPDDVVWIHDYHLIPLASYLRKLGVRNRIGFFLHTPWPARQLLVTLPHHGQMVRAMGAYDLIGFHTEEWRGLFCDYLIEQAQGKRLDSDTVAASGEIYRTGVFPIGIDVEGFVEGSHSELAIRTLKRMNKSGDGRSMMVGVDRLDYSKGIEERLSGFEQFLTDHEEWRKRVFLLQVTPLSRDTVDSYQDIRERLEGLAGRVNGQFADMDWQPIRYLNRTYRRDQLAGIYRASRVGLVTALRDGMNLVAKEYVAAQNPDDPGVLILSRFTGAAEQMTAALLVNPYAREELADAIYRALEMPLEERIERWQSLMDVVRHTDIAIWRDTFVSELQATAVTPPRFAASVH